MRDIEGREAEREHPNYGAVIHMATSGQGADGTWGWICRCDEGGSGYTSKAAARAAGDEHLAKANRGEASNSTE